MTGIEHFIVANPFLSYALIFLGMFIEGEFIVLFASIFAWQGHLDWRILAVVVASGIITGDLTWYAIGRYLRGTRLGNWLDIRFERSLGWIHDRFVANYHLYAIPTKFIYYVNRATVFLNGWRQTNFKRFFWITCLAGITWTIIVVAVGSFVGYAVYLIGFRAVMKRIELVALGLFLSIFIIERSVKKYIISRKH